MSPAATARARVRCASAAATRELGRSVAGLLRAGDLLVLTGGLGAGKTTFTQGLAAGLGVVEPVTSPTFVLARRHPSATGRPTRVDVDAYRLSGLEELDDLDLDADLEESVTVVEWGAGIAEVLARDRLDVALEPEPLAGPGAVGTDGDGPGGDGLGGLDLGGDEPRVVTLTGVGHRWVGVGLPR